MGVLGRRRRVAIAASATTMALARLATHRHPKRRQRDAGSAQAIAVGLWNGSERHHQPAAAVLCRQAAQLRGGHKQALHGCLGKTGAEVDVQRLQRTTCAIHNALHEEIEHIKNDSTIRQQAPAWCSPQ